MFVDTVLPYSPTYSYEELHGSTIQTSQLDNGRVKMLEHLKKQMEILKSENVSHSYYETDEEVTLCWFDKNEARNSISIWLDDCEGIWSSARKGKIIDTKEFENINDFLLFSAVK